MHLDCVAQVCLSIVVFGMHLLRCLVFCAIALQSLQMIYNSVVRVVWQLEGPKTFEDFPYIVSEGWSMTFFARVLRTYSTMCHSFANSCHIVYMKDVTYYKSPL